MRPTLIDAHARVTGSITFGQDLRVAGELRAVLLRSREPSAILRGIDTTRASKVAGVAGVFTGPDLASRLGRPITFGPIYRDQPALALERVRYAGEPIAAVVAVDVDAAREALDRIEVDYEPLPAVLDLDAALAEAAPLVHPDVRPAGSYGFAAGPAGSNVCNTFRLRRGDVDAGFAAADHVFDDTFETPPVQHAALETHGAAAVVRGGQVTVWSGTQTPHGTRTQLAELFGLPATHVRVLVPAIGGAFGSKGHAKLEPLAALLALATGRPVRIQLERAEEFVTITKHGARIRLRTGVMADGRIVARAAECWFDTGAYADIGPRVVWFGGMGAAGPYAIDNIAVDGAAVYTNLPPAGAFRGFGFPQACWAHERQMDLIADALGLDPLEIRLRNVIADGGPYSTGEPFLDGHLDELLRDAAQAVGWDPAERRSEDGRRVRARGIACVAKGTIVPSVSTAIVKLSDDGSLDVLSSSVDLGQGVRTTLAILAGEVLGLTPDRVNVGPVDTASTPYDSMTSASRTTGAMGAAVADAAAQVRRQLLALASEALEAAEEDLVVAGGRISVRGSAERGIELGQLVRRARAGNLVGTGRFQRLGGLDPETGQGVGSVHWTSGVGAAEVEVDLDTGAVKLVRYHAGTYAGRVVNRQMAELQVEGCVAFGVGQAFMEELVFDDGQLMNASLADYLLPALGDVPRPSMTLLEGGPGAEIHGVGEAALPPVMPAIANAVARATGVQLTRTPVTAEAVLRGLRGGDRRVTVRATNQLPAVLAAIDADAPRSIERLCELIRRPSRTGHVEEVRACGEWLVAGLLDDGFTAELVDVDAGAPVIFAEVPAPPGAPTLLFYSHYDVISPEPVDAWSYPPFGAVREDGRIYGRGATDAKANVLSIVEGVAAWRRVAGSPPVGIKLMLDGEEEAGSSNLPGFLELMGDRLRADGAVSFDGGVDASGRSKIGLGTSGMLFVELRARGARRELHSAGARIFPNPAWRLVWALASIKGPDETIPIKGFNEPIQPPGETDRKMMAAMGWGGRQQLREAGVEDFVLGLSDEAALERLLFQPGLALAGINAGFTGPGMKAVIPTDAIAKLEFRIVPDQDPNEVLAQLRAHLDRNGFADIAIEVLATVETAKTDPDSALVAVVADAARAQFGGAMVKPTEEYAGRQGAWLGEMLGIPGVQTGVGPPGFRGHAADEFVTEEHFLKGIRLAASILAGYADLGRG